MSNSAVRHSIKNGETIKVGNALYRGRNPQYVEMQEPGNLVKTWKKITKGIPWVRVVAND